jgi:hypothetical protein
MFITILKGPVTEWARSHPGMFFDRAEVTARIIAERVADGARILGAPSAEVSVVGEWHVVAAREDWFPNARLPLPADFRFDHVIAFPEQGQNCTRAEFLAAAFARNVMVMAADAEPVILGKVSSTDEIHAFLAQERGWRRVVAFRSVGLEIARAQPVNNGE